MKKLFALFAVLLLISACDTGPDPNHVPYDYTCERPAEIPDTTCNGKKIHWDCDWYVSYTQGRVKILTDSCGCITSVGRSMIYND